MNPPTPTAYSDIPAEAVGSIPYLRNACLPKFKLNTGSQTAIVESCCHAQRKRRRSRHSCPASRRSGQNPFLCRHLATPLVIFACLLAFRLAIFVCLLAFRLANYTIVHIFAYMCAKRATTNLAGPQSRMTRDLNRRLAGRALGFA